MFTFALDHKNRRTHIDDTQSKLTYYCPYCGAPLITKKGQVRRHHYAHMSGRICSDSWSKTYDLSEWHFEWQERFPKENQERCLRLDTVRHRADVVVGRTVIEFQKSALTPWQFNDRNTFTIILAIRSFGFSTFESPMQKESFRGLAKRIKNSTTNGQTRNRHSIVTTSKLPT